MIIDHIRDLDEFAELFKNRPMQTDVYTLDFIVKNPHLYCFYDEETSELLGFIFLTEYKKRLFLSGVSCAVTRNRMAKIKNAILTICKSYKTDVYSDTDLKHAQYVLRQAGFKRLRNTNIFKRSK